MYILGINCSHHGSICLLKDGEVLFFLEEERLSHKKYSLLNDDSYDVLSIIPQYTENLNYISIMLDGNHLGMSGDSFIFEYNEDAFKSIIDIIVDKSNELYKNFNITGWDKVIENLTKIAKNSKVYVDLNSHHNIHASQSFYNSGFTEAVCVVVDGQGSSKHNDNTDTMFERESVWKFSYDSSEVLFCNYNIPVNGVGSTYSYITEKIGFGQFEEGKTMGLSSYKPTTEIINYARTVQLWSQEQVLNLIKYAIDISGSKNVCLSGGYALNCVANYYFRQNLPSDVNLYCEPIANDSGHAIGLAKKLYHKVTMDKTIRPQRSLYLGPEPVY